MRTLQTILFLLAFAATCTAQSYQPFPGQWTYNYSYPASQNVPTGVWSVRVDGFTVQANDTTFYFNRIVRYPAAGDSIYKCNGELIFPSTSHRTALIDQDNIFGRTFQKLAGGVVEFDATTGGPFRLETQAQTGDSWIFDMTTGETATVLSHDLEQVFGTSDSVKTIALSSGGQLKLSKSHGFTETVAFLPMLTIGYGYPISRELDLIGVDEPGWGKSLPSFQEVFGLLEVNDTYQQKYFSYASYGETNLWENNTILTKDDSGGDFVYEIEREALSITENYIFSGGSWFDTTYTPSLPGVLYYFSNNYTYFELLPGEIYPPSGPNATTSIPNRVSILPDGRLERSYLDRRQYDPCAGAIFSEWFDGSSSREFQHGLGHTGNSVHTGGSSGASYWNTCYNTQFAGTGGTCANLQAGGILIPVAPPATISPTGPIGVFGNAAGTSLKLVTGEKEMAVEVFDAMGRKTTSRKLDRRGDGYTFDASNWGAGVYFFHVTYEGGHSETYKTVLMD